MSKLKVFSFLLTATAFFIAAALVLIRGLEGNEVFYFILSFFWFVSMWLMASELSEHYKDYSRLKERDITPLEQRMIALIDEKITEWEIELEGETDPYAASLEVSAINDLKQLARVIK